MRLPALLVAASALAARGFNLSNTLGDGMVLQRAPQAAIVWGFGAAGSSVAASLDGEPLPAVFTGSDSIWRVQLPPMPARSEPSTISFVSSDGDHASLRDVLFGDVFLCSGQSNMQYTPRSMDGMNNMSAEIASADAFSSTIRIFTVGMDTSCGDPTAGKTDCSRPFTQLNPRVPLPPEPCPGSRSCRKPWAAATSATVGGRAWDDFSAGCFLFGRQMHIALGVPVGLISSNWGGTPVQAWSPVEALRECGGAGAGGALYNSMIAPFTVGPMALSGAIWYQVCCRGGCYMPKHTQRAGHACYRVGPS
jgi:sialate O-acetylesterase